ncbi:MAG: hypothetical protein GXP14_12835 [Gammaproteobacteria bacterium]|nr:hypothetical protein [Gammaproteobacteria bacterium]
MKKSALISIIGIIIFAAVAGNYYLNQKKPTMAEQPGTPLIPEQKQLPMPSSLSYVPQDTFAFAGGLELYSVDDLVTMLKSQQSNMSDLTYEKLQKEILNDEDTPVGFKMPMFTLFELSSSVEKDPKALVTRLGLSDKVDSAIYTVGMLPVFRLKIENTDNFNAFIQDIEKKNNILGVEKSFEKVSYRSYTFDIPGTKKPSEISFIIAVHDNYAIFSIETPFEREHYLSLVLGIDKPKKALSDSSLLSNISTQYKLHPAYLAFFNHVVLTKAVTNSSQNDFGKMLNEFIDQDGEHFQNKGFANIRTPACQKELVDMAKNWPRTVMGYTKISLDTTPLQMDSRVLFESNNKDMLEQLRSLRGFIPVVLNDAPSRALLSLALGLNVDALLPFIKKITADITATPYSCEPLKKMQLAISENPQSPAIAMASMMLSGVKGLSISLLDIDFTANDTGEKPEIKSLDALITLSTNDPSGLLDKALAMAPAPYDTLQVAADGQAIDFPIPMQLPSELQTKIAIKGQHIVIYIGGDGEKAANQLSTEALSENGLFAFNIGYEKYSRILKKAMNILEDMDEEKAEIFQSMDSFNADMNFLIDVNQYGLVIDTQLTIH